MASIRREIQVNARPEKVWEGMKDKKKTARDRAEAVRRRRYQILRAEGMELPVGSDAIHENQLAAAAGAFTAYLWATRQVREDGPWVIPAED